MTNQLDLQDEVRMVDTYNDITNILSLTSKLSVYPPLVWLWAWDNVLCEVKNFEEDPEYVVNHSEFEIFQKFWQDADKNDLSLEFGTENLYEAVRGWLIDADIVSYKEEENEVE